MNEESKIILDKFQPRPYQQEIIDALDQGYKKIVVVLPRRAGKDMCGWNIAIRQCIKKVCLVQYVLPTFRQARETIFDAIDIDGNRFLDYIPKRLIAKVNIAEQKIVFTNGSVLHCIGGDVHDKSIRGTNPFMVILSEYAYMKSDEIYSTIRPILATSGGICIFLSTPWGKNHFYSLFQLAKTLPDWKVIFKTVKETRHISDEVLLQERAQMSEHKYEQEYNCSFTLGIDGSYFGKNLQALRDKGQITSVAWEPGLQVHTAWDIGFNDATTIIFFQVVGDGTVIRIIDCYSNNNLGMDSYINVIQNKPYTYGKHFAPHDIEVHESSDGITRWEKANRLGLHLEVLDKALIMDGIENVWTHFPKFWIDKNNCRTLIDALENYRREWDEQNQMYKNKPVHNWASHYADAMRYLCQSINKTQPGLTAEEFEKQRAKALYGPDRFRQRIFQSNPRYDR